MFEDIFLLIRNRLLERPQRPSNLYVIVEDSAMADMMKVKVLLPSEADRDTVKRIFRYYVNGEVVSSIYIPKDQPDLMFDVPQDAQVKLELINVDDSGNKSTPAVFEFVAADTIPPAAPGQMSVQIVEETFTCDSDVPACDDNPCTCDADVPACDDAPGCECDTDVVEEPPVEEEPTT